MSKPRGLKNWRFLVIIVAFIAILSSRVPAIQTSAWAPNTTYAVGAQVTFQGSVYQCRQAHTSIVGWEPPNVPALWQLVTGGGGGGGGTTDTQAPTAPTNLRVTATTSSSISLAWNASTDNVGVSGYDILRGGALIGGSSSTTFTAGGLAAGTTFTFTVRARDAAGNLSALSNAVNGTTATGGGGGQPSAWAPNTAYTVGVQVTFQGSVYRCLQAHTSQIGWEPTNAIALWQLVTGGGGGGGGGDTQAPTAPTNLRVVSTTATSVFLAWNASTDNVAVTAYDIFQGGTNIANTTSTSFTVAGLASGTSFTFTVRARDAAGNPSAMSNAVSATTTPNGGGGVGNEQAFPGHVYAPYADVLVFPSLNLTSTAASSGTRFYHLAFIIDDNASNCVASWGGGIRVINDLSDPNFKVDDIRTLRQSGGGVIVSFGGAVGDELAKVCTNVPNLQAQYQSVIDKYGLRHVDFDIEGAPNTDPRLAGDSIDKRNKAIAALQRANPGLEVSYTLAVLPSGLLDDTLALLRNAVANGVNIGIVNIMAFDYGAAVADPTRMGQNAIDAANSVARQLGGSGLFPNLSMSQRLAKVGLTLMIGRDDLGAITTQADAQQVTTFARNNNLGRLSIWNANRDHPCTNGRNNLNCSGTQQTDFEFSRILNAFTR